jgi:phospholipid/cholesterol/gamma-HCH transport system substrate-binding protein
MTRLSTTTIRIIASVVAVAIVIGLVFYLFSGGATRSVSANFTSGVGVYSGTPVKILGVQVGTVSKVTPKPDSVLIDMHYDAKYIVPSDAIAVTVANSLVSDRYIQLQWQDGDTAPRMADGANIPLSRTASPAELDDIYSALNKLSTALGPNGANSNGALSTLFNVAAANLQGNGAALGQSITALSQAATTLANGKDDLFGTVQHLKDFSAALLSSDKQVRSFEDELSQVSADLANERSDLGSALHNLSIALTTVANFVKDNSSAIHSDVVGLESVTGTLVKDQAALNETLTVAPIALANIVHAYQESSGTLGTRSNLAGLTDPTLQICGLLNGISSGGILGVLIGNLLGTVPSQIITYCNKLTAPLSPKSADVSSILTQGLTTANGGGS